MTKTMKTKVIVLFFLCCLNSAFARKVTHTELNGYVWYEEITQVRSGQQSYIHRAFDTSGKDIFGKTYGIKFHCIGTDDEGQFIVTHKFDPTSYGEGIYSKDGTCISPPESHKFIYKRFKSGDRYYYITHAINDNFHSLYGVIDDMGNEILPAVFEGLSFEIYGSKKALNGFLCVEKYHTTSEGLIDFNGNYIIEPEEHNFIQGNDRFIEAHTKNGYSLLTYDGEFIVKDTRVIIEEEPEHRYKVYMKNGSMGYLDYSGNWILSPDLGYSDFVDFIGPSNNTFYKAKSLQNNIYGILDNSGGEILPCEFEEIEYIGGEYFKFKSGTSWGVVTLQGKIIIPTSRGYDSIGRYSSIQKTIPFTKSDYKGECNSSGKQISFHKDTTPSSQATKNSGQTTNLIFGQPYLTLDKKYTISKVIDTSGISSKIPNLTLELSDSSLGLIINIYRGEKVIAAHFINPFKKSADNLYISWEYDTLKIAAVEYKNSQIIVSIYHNHDENKIETFVLQKI